MPFNNAERSNLYKSRDPLTGDWWKDASKAFLVGKRCAVRDCVTPPTVTDHDPPHRGNVLMFWNKATWQPLCSHHHNQKTGQEIASRHSNKRPVEAHPGMVR